MTKIKKEKEEVEIFSTRDLYLASTLVTLRFFMTGTDYQIEGERKLPVGYFKFDLTPELMKAKDLYLQGQLAVEPRAFITNLKSLKSEVNGKYKSPHSKF